MPQKVQDENSFHDEHEDIQRLELNFKLFQANQKLIDSKYPCQAEKSYGNDDRIYERVSVEYDIQRQDTHQVHDESVMKIVPEHVLEAQGIAASHHYGGSQYHKNVEGLIEDT